jgi:hypothetical protein
MEAKIEVMQQGLQSAQAISNYVGSIIANELSRLNE